MNTNVETQGFSLTPALGSWTHSQVAESLGRFEQAIRRIDFHLSDAHGPEGGTGMSAAITVFLKHRAPIRIATVRPDGYAAIAVTAKRAEQAVERALSKRRSLQRSARRWRYANAVTAPL